MIEALVSSFTKIALYTSYLLIYILCNMDMYGEIYGSLKFNIS